jgi:RimJ/RimL family protein N-acetyltransferase
MTQRTVFLKGKVTSLCLPHKEDIPKITEWVNTHDVIQYLHSFMPSPFEEEERWYERITKGSPTDFTFFLVAHDSQELLGTMGIHGINYRQGHGTTGAMIGNQKFHGKGYGTDAKMQLLHWAFTELNLRKVMSNVLSTNPRSKRYLEKTGYREIGCRKRHSLFRGEFVDEHVMEVFKEDFMPLWYAYVNA